MKKVKFLTLSLFFLCFALIFPVNLLDAQAQRGNTSPSRLSGAQPQSRPANNPLSAPSRSTPQRPQTQPRTNHAPSQSNRQSSQRPTSPSSRPTQPSNNRPQTPSNTRPTSPSNNRPSPPSFGNRPNNSRPTPNHRPNFNNSRYPNRMIVRHHFPRTVYVLPIGYHPFRWMGMHYSFYNGFFFRPYGGAFIICRPPIGFVIAATTLRTAPLTPVIFNPTIVIYGHPQQHYYNEGTYYVRVSPSEYKVVVPPIGARVFSIPEDSEEFILDGYTYYRVDDTYYALVYVDGATMFEVVGRDER